MTVDFARAQDMAPNTVLYAVRRNHNEAYLDFQALANELAKLRVKYEARRTTLEVLVKTKRIKFVHPEWMRYGAWRGQEFQYLDDPHELAIVPLFTMLRPPPGEGANLTYRALSDDSPGAPVPSPELPEQLGDGLPIGSSRT